MTGLFRPSTPFLQSTGWQNATLNALRYNTTPQGAVIPLLYGTTRQPSLLIDLMNYRGPNGSGKKGMGVGSLPLTGTSLPTGKGGGSSKGKGGKKGAKKNPNFSVDVAIAWCQGPVAGILNIYSSAGVESFSSAQGHFYYGADGQTVDPTFNSLGHTVNYSGTSYSTWTPMDMGQSPVLPNISGEIQGILVGTDVGSYGYDANPGDVMNDFLTNSRYGAEFPSAHIASLIGANSYGAYCQAAQLLISVTLDGKQRAIEWLDGLAKLTNSAMFFSGGLFKVVPYGDLALSTNGATWTPNLISVYDFTDDHFLPWHAAHEGHGPEPGQEDPILVTRSNPADAFNWYAIEYTDRANFYNTTTISVFDQGAIDTYGLRMGDTIQGRAFCSPTPAQISAQLQLQRTLYIRDTPYRFKVGWQFAPLDPMDIVTLTGRAGDSYLVQEPVRVTAYDIDENGDITVEAERIQAGVAPPPPRPINLFLQPAGGTGYGAGYPWPSGTSTPSTTGTINNTVAWALVTSITATDGITPPVTTSSISDNSGGVLTWHKRWGFVQAIPVSSTAPLQEINIEFWWADARALTSTFSLTVTANMSAVANLPTIWTGYLYGDIDYTHIWDPNVSLPAVGVNTLNPPSVSGISTSSPNSCLFAFIATVARGAPGTPNNSLGTTFVTTTGHSPLWGWPGAATGVVLHWGIGSIVGTGQYFNVLGAEAPLHGTTSGTYTGISAIPFASSTNNPNINTSNGGYIMIVDAVAGTG